MDAEGVEYFEIQACGQSIRAFNCPTYRCTLSPRSCAERFLAAQHLTDQAGVGHPAFSCKRCPIGAAHADAKGFRPKRKAECLRCGQWAHKLVRGLLCVGCYNRQQEVLKGADRRGHPPKVTSLFLSLQPVRQRGAIPLVMPIQVQAGNMTLTIPAATFREALLAASRMAFKGEPIELRILNAGEVGRAVPYLRHCHNAPQTRAA